MAKKVDKKSASNPQNWKIAQRYIRIEHNQTVVKWFRVSNSIARTNLRNSLLIYNKDTASQMLVKMQFFAQYIQKTDDELLSLPLQFKTRVLPNIPQLAIIFRPTDKKIRTGNYTLHIPHYNGSKTPSISGHTKGNHWAKFTCKDGAGVMCYASSKATAIKIVTEMNRYVSRRYKSDQLKPSTGYMEHEPNKKVKVKPIRADYYKDGKKNNPVPDWKYYFR